MEYEALEDTAFGDTARSRIAGLGDSTSAPLQPGHGRFSATDVTLYTAYATKAPVVVKVRATTAAISATNPEYVGSYLPNQHNPFGNGVGELATSQISWPLSDSDGHRPQPHLMDVKISGAQQIHALAKHIKTLGDKPASAGRWPGPHQGGRADRQGHQRRGRRRSPRPATRRR
jgi:hypothetical protein